MWVVELHIIRKKLSDYVSAHWATAQKYHNNISCTEGAAVAVP